MTQRLLTTSEAAGYLGCNMDYFRGKYRLALSPVCDIYRARWDVEDLRRIKALELDLPPSPTPLTPAQRNEIFYALAMFQALRRHIAAGSPIGRKMAHLFYTLTHPQTEGAPHD